MKFLCDMRLLRAQIWEMRHNGLENAIQRASDEEIGAAYALVEHRHETSDIHNVALMIAMVRASPDMFEFAKGLSRPHDVDMDSHEEENIAVRGAEDSSLAHGAQNTGRHRQAVARRRRSTRHLYTYDKESVQGCIDQCVMSGAVHADDKIKRRGSSDSLICSDDLETMLDNMPWKILVREDIAEMDLLEDSTNIEIIPDEWRTTVLGVSLGCFDQASYCDSGTDQTMLAALEMRGGMVLKSGDVEYPEDIVPDISTDDVWYDDEYWAALEEQGAMGRVWSEVFPDKYPEDVTMQDT